MQPPETVAAARLGTLSALVARLTAAATPDAAVAAALEALEAALALDAAAVVVSGEDAAGPHCRAARGLPPAVAGALAGVGSTVPAWVWNAGAQTPEPPPGGNATAWVLELGADGDALTTTLAAAGFASAAFVPMTGGGRNRGCLALFSRCARHFVGHDRAGQDMAIAALIAGLLGQVLFAAELRATQEQLTAAAARNASRVERLTRVAGTLSSTPTSVDVATMIITEAHEALDADWSGVWLLDARAATLTAVATKGMPEAMRPSCQVYAAGDTSNPLCFSVASNEPLWLENWDDYARRFPASQQRVRNTRPSQIAFACLPLRIETRTIGGLVLCFFKERHFDPDERAFMGLFAQHCAQGIERARLYDQALDAVQAREDFLSVAGHELRTPLATLLLQTQLHLGGRSEKSDDKGDDAEARARVLPMQRTLRRLIKLADDVLDVSRIRAGRLRLEPEPMDLGAMVRDVATRTALGLQWPEGQLHIQVGGLLRGHWDPIRLEQVVVNLVSNACKYGAGQPIEVNVAAGPGYAELRVRDRGIGIAAQDQARIFERFERAARTREIKGMGLGLWIVREIVAAHQGSISVRSEPGAGAEFCVRLPLGEDEPASMA